MQSARFSQVEDFHHPNTFHYDLKCGNFDFLQGLISCCPLCDILYGTTLKMQQSLGSSPFLPVFLPYSAPRPLLLPSPNNISHS